MKDEIEKVKFFSSLAFALNYIGEYCRAEELYKKSLEIREQVLGESHPNTQIIYENLKLTYLELNPKGDFVQWLEGKMKETK